MANIVIENISKDNVIVYLKDGSGCFTNLQAQAVLKKNQSVALDSQEGDQFVVLQRNGI